MRYPTINTINMAQRIQHGAILAGCWSILAATMAGCAGLPQNADKAAISTCATAGAYGQAISKVYPQLDAKTHANLEILAPYCTASTPGAAMTAAETNALAWLTKEGKPLTAQTSTALEGNP